ncbi:MAG: hypothetical protein ACRER8_16210 [Pseudomonas sp.]|uniref:hypothetical protein n=1 Tax=Pseudomonas sp. TaxID=306 RepID=UPI003D6E18B9
MSIATVNYFHSATLRQRYIDELDAALRDKRIRDQEHAWLQDVTRPVIAGGADPVRVDRLMPTHGSFRPFELSAALLFSHVRGNDPRLYLYTLANGIGVFSDRRALSTVLRAQFAEGDPDALFEYEKIDGDPFRAQTLELVDQQVEQVGELTTQLRMTPSLFEAASASISYQLRTTLVHWPIDPRTHLLQLVADSTVGIETAPVTQTLAQATFDDCCDVQIEKGYTRRFLDAQGRLANSTDTVLLSQALANAAAGVAERYAALLKTFWNATWCAQRTRRQLAIDSFASSWRRELYCGLDNDVLSADLFNALRPLLQSLSGALPKGTALRCSRLTVRIGEVACELAGTFVVHPGTDDHSLLWFSPDHSLVRFSDQAALSAHFATVEGRAQLRPTLALEDQPILLAEDLPQLTLETIQAPVFADRIDSILTLQARNLAHVMGLSSAPEAMTAMIDDALDIRQLLDPRQLQFSAGRWRRDAPFHFADVWSQPRPVAAVATQLSAVEGGNMSTRQGRPAMDIDASKSLTTSWIEYAQAFDWRAECLRRSDCMLSDYAEQALQQFVCVLVDGSVRARTIQVQWLESAPVESSDVETRGTPVSESQQLISMDLVSLLLEVVSGHRCGYLAAGAQVVLDASTAPRHLQLEVVNHMLEKVVTKFADRYVDDFKRSRYAFQRQSDQQLQPAREALSLREDAARLDLALSLRQKRIDDAAAQLVRQVLDRPLRSLRLALGGPVTEAFFISLTYGHNPAAMLCDTLVLRQPSSPGSPVVLWCCEFGWRQYASVEKLQAMLQRELHLTHPERWLALLGAKDCAALRAHLSKASDNQVQIRLERIDGHAIETLQQQVVDRAQQDLRALCMRAARCRLEAGLFTRLAAALELDRQLISMLDALSVRIDNSIFEAMLPPWMDSASIADLKHYYGIFTRFYLASDGGRDFLFGVPSLQDYAHGKLVAQLGKDFPGQPMDPDQITVTSRRYVNALPAAGQLPSAVPAATVGRSESLTQYAINRFVDAQDAALGVDSLRYPQAARLLTLGYIRQLVRRQDVGAGYRVLLRKALMPGDPRYAQRRDLFVAQLPPALLATALTEKVKGKLSATAYEFVSRVLDMPDGIAREPVDGVRVILSPLQLVADRGMNPDPVAGVYLICPVAPAVGPVVLYATYHLPFTLREYASQAALLKDIRTDTSLQQLLLDRVDSQVRRRYEHGGFVEPHLPFSVGLYDVPLRAPGPVTLELAEVKGNALQFLFRDAVKVLLDTGVSNSVTNAQADRAGRAFLATLALSQVLNLLPSKLAALVTLWQSHTLFRASAVSVSGHRWGEALSEFTAALGVMVTAREQAIDEKSIDEQTLQKQPSEDRSGNGEALAAGEWESLPSGFSWRGTSLNAQQRMRLQGLEAQSVALNDMRHDELLNLYFDKRDNSSYAVVNGKVFQVRRVTDEGRWIIVGADGTTGPQILLSGDQRWQLDLSLRLRGGGGVVTKLRTSVAISTAEDALIVEASGMPEIRLRYRDRARRISQAHLQASRYLENCLDNLGAARRRDTLDPRVAQIVDDFFGAASADQTLLNEIESAIKTLADALMDASLSPFSSSRFVVGANRPGRERLAAFTIPQDPQQRIFLTERFFRVPIYRLKPEAAAEGFDASVHYRAATLLHELSHLALGTKDITYLETGAPYPDLLRENTAANLRTRAEIERLHESRLSHRTRKNALFKLLENGQWRDITGHDALGYSTILRITQAKTLDEARDVFLSDVYKRARVMLSNADSVALLIVRLGRNNYAADT